MYFVQYCTLVLSKTLHIGCNAGEAEEAVNPAEAVPIRHGFVFIG